VSEQVTTDLGLPGRGPGGTRYLLRWADTLTLSVLDLGLACCAVEFAAAVLSHPGFVPLENGAHDAGHPEVLVVSGTVTDAMAPAVRRLHAQLATPSYVVSFGSCANSGGPYWDSYCVTKGVDQLVPVDVYVPGCPPRPEALVHGLRLLQDRLTEADR
jgi:NADH-quinone oxidoreductase subunit B